MTSFQLFPNLDAATEAALRASIKRHGVLVPVAVDQQGNIIDGHHRARIAEELGVEFDVVELDIRDDMHGRELAATLNVVRRHLDPDQRRAAVAELRAQGHSLRAIGGALGVSAKTIHGDLATVTPETVPERIVGLDGKSRPARRPAGEVVPGDLVTDDHGDEREVAGVEVVGEETVLFDDEGEAIIAGTDREMTVRSPIAKPDLGDGVSHPARYSAELMPVLQAAVPIELFARVLDPFAGTGRIHELANTTVGVEIEPEWAALHPDTQVGSALDLPFDDEAFDAIVTSPTYGNRLADHHNASDPERRRSYTHDLGRPLHEDNSGAMQWGSAYREFHTQAWAEAWRIVRPGGRFVLNIKDHVRDGERQHVAGWHVTELILVGFELLWCVDVGTRQLRQGENAELRFDEQVFVFGRPGP